MVIRDGERLEFEKGAALGCDAVFLEAALGFFGEGVFDEPLIHQRLDGAFKRTGFAAQTQGGRQFIGGLRRFTQLK